MSVESNEGISLDELENCHWIVKTIQEILSGKEWDSDTLAQIAQVLIEEGYEINERGNNGEESTR